MTPKTPLPWTELPCYFDNQCQAFEPQDAEFMLEACNQFSRLESEIKQLKEDKEFYKREIDYYEGLCGQWQTKCESLQNQIDRLRRHVNIGPGIE